MATRRRRGTFDVNANLSWKSLLVGALAVDSGWRIAGFVMAWANALFHKVESRLEDKAAHTREENPKTLIRNGAAFPVSLRPPPGCG